MHEQPALTGRGLFRGERYPESERIARRGFYIPSGTALTDEQMEYAAGQVVSVWRGI
jgi:perosamine synthetase